MFYSHIKVSICRCNWKIGWCNLNVCDACKANYTCKSKCFYYFFDVCACIILKREFVLLVDPNHLLDLLNLMTVVLGKDCRPWGKNPIQVFYRQLGYAGGLKSIGWPTNDTVPKITRLLFCKGHEKHILEYGFINSNVGRCQYNPAVVCQEHVSG